MGLSAGAIAFVALSCDDAFESFTFVLLEDFPVGSGLPVSDRSITFHLRSWDGQQYGVGGSALTWTAPADRTLPAGTLIQINPNQAQPGQPGQVGTVNLGSIELNAPLPHEGGWNMQWGEVLYANAGYNLWNPNILDPNDPSWRGDFLTAIGLNAPSNWLDGTGLSWADPRATANNLPAPYWGSQDDVLSISRDWADRTYASADEARLAYNSNGIWVADGGVNDGAADNPLDTNNPEGDALGDRNSPLYNRSSLPICFLAGTMIRTPAGEVAIEALRIGDEVLTHAGQVRPVRWIGRQSVSTRFGDPERVLPIRIRAGALGESLPCRDLLVSPDHALLVDGILIQAGALANGTSIARWREVPEVFTYYHVELVDHALILAENVPAETFIDHVERRNFDNWKEHEALYPDPQPIPEMDYPRAKSARQVPVAVRKKLFRQAVRLGTQSLHAA